MNRILILLFLSFFISNTYSQIRYTNCSETQSNPFIGWDKWVTGMTDVEIVNKGSGIYKISVFMNGAKYPFERHEVRYSEIYEGQYKYDVIKSECEPNKGKYILSNKKLSIISKEEQPDSMIAILYDDKMIFGFKLEN